MTERIQTYARGPKIIPQIYFLISGWGVVREWECKEALDKPRIISDGASRLGVVPTDKEAPSGVYRHGG